jgi:hypothetical protein
MGRIESIAPVLAQIFTPLLGGSCWMLAAIGGNGRAPSIGTGRFSFGLFFSGLVRRH